MVDRDNAATATAETSKSAGGPDLLSDGALQALGDRALDILFHPGQLRPWERADEGDDEGDDAFGPVPSAALVLEAWAALRVAATGLVGHAHVASLGTLARWAEDLEQLEHNYDPTHATRGLATAAVELAGELLVGDARQLELALTDPRAGVRQALVAHLDGAQPAQQAALERLAGDPELTVRRAAREKLGGAMPWWQGLFGDDPTTQLEAETAGALERLFAAGPRELHAISEDAMHALFAQLAPPHQLCAHRWAVRANLLPYGRSTRHLVALATLSGEALAELAWELLEQDRGAFCLEAQELTQIPAQERCTALTRLAARVAQGDGAALRRRQSHRLATLFSRLCADTCDPGPLLVAALGGPVADAAERAEEHSAGYAVSNTLSQHPLLHRYAAIIEQAHQSGRPGAWAGLPDEVYEAALGARRLAHEALASDDEEARRRAVHQLLTTLHAPEQDGSIDELAQRFFADPRTQADVLTCADGCAAVMAQLRARLARPSALDVVTLAETMRAVSGIDGGLVRSLMAPGPGPEGAFDEAVWQALREGWATLDPDVRSVHAELFASVLPPGAGLEARDRQRVLWLLDHPPPDHYGVARALHLLLAKRDAAVDAFLLEIAPRIPHGARGFLRYAGNPQLPPGLLEALEREDPERVAQALRCGAQRFP